MSGCCMGVVLLSEAAVLGKVWGTSMVFIEVFGAQGNTLTGPLPVSAEAGCCVGEGLACRSAGAAVWGC